MQRSFFVLLLPLLTAACKPPKMKVLCLHGYAQCGAVLRDRSGGFRKPLKKSMHDFFYPDGPHDCTAQGEDAAEAAAALSRRAWWRASSKSDVYEGWDMAKSELLALWDQENFDGVLGFSQGAAAAAMIAAERRPSFAILVSGFIWVTLMLSITRVILRCEKKF